MKFWQALKLMQEKGKKMRREGWEKGDYIYFDKYPKPKNRCLRSQEGNIFATSNEAYSQDDWEEYHD